MKLSNRAQTAIRHAQRTTGTIQWCGVGVYSGDGRYGLESNSCRYNTPDSVRDYLKAYCVPFTSDEVVRANVNYLRRVERYKRLAIQAIHANKFTSACNLADSAEHVLNKSREIVAGECRFYRIETHI